MVSGRKTSLTVAVLFLGLVGASLPAAPPAGSKPSPSETAEIFSRAEKLANLYFLEESVALYKRCVEAEYENFDYHLGLIDAYVTMDKVSELIPYYSVRVLGDNKDYIARLGMALCNYHQRNLEIARRYAEDAKRLRPDSAYVYYCLALIARSEAPAQAGEVERFYREAFRLAPDFARAYTSYVYWQWSLRHARRATALSIIDKALALRNPDPMIYYWKNDVLKSDLNYDPRQGIQVLKKALEMDSSLAFISIAIGELYAALGQAQPARTGGDEEATYRDVIRRAPNYIEGYLHLGAALKKWHRYDEAIEVYKEAAHVPFQEVQKHWSDLRIGECLYYAQLWDEASEQLEEVIKRYPGSYMTHHAKSLLSALISRSPSDKIVLLDGVPYLTQRGNWCGPAALSMLLGYWGSQESLPVQAGQEEIAKEIYTGIAGTAPQIIEDYCRARGFVVRTFEGSLERWRKLLDQRIPFLWLAMLRKGGGHYVVVTGYDDIKKEVIVHNPWFSDESLASYKDLDDLWMLPSLRRTIAMVPAANAEKYDLSGLEPSLRLRLINFVLYIATASNLYRGVFPQVLINLLFIGVLLAVLSIYLYFCIFPRGMKWVLAYILLNFSFVIFCSSAISSFRSGFWVSLLLGYHLSILSLLLVAPILWLFNVFVQDYFTRKEFLGLALITFIVFLMPAAVQKEGWETYLPLLFLIGAVMITFRQRFVLLRAASRLRRGLFVPALRTCERLGSLPAHRAGSRLGGDPYYAALFLEVQTRIELCQFDAAASLIEYVLRRRPLTAYRRQLLELWAAEAELFLSAQQAGRDGASVCSSGRLRPRHDNAPKRGLTTNSFYQGSERDGQAGGDHDEVRTERSGAGNRLLRTYARCIEAHAAWLRGDCSRAVELGDAAREELRRRDFARTLARFIEFMRCQRSLQPHFALLNLATLVEAYRGLGLSEKADEILREHADWEDLAFRLKRRVLPGR
jgi:tetratricopeptide (TPR) repeat protein